MALSWFFAIITATAPEILFLTIAATADTITAAYIFSLAAIITAEILSLTAITTAATALFSLVAINVAIVNFTTAAAATAATAAAIGLKCYLRSTFALITTVAILKISMFAAVTVIIEACVRFSTVCKWGNWDILALVAIVETLAACTVGTSSVAAATEVSAAAVLATAASTFTLFLFNLWFFF